MFVQTHDTEIPWYEHVDTSREKKNYYFNYMYIKQTLSN